MSEPNESASNESANHDGADDAAPSTRTGGVGGTDAALRPRARVAYFSMEIGLEAGLPTYAGGLGILAGDTIRSAADLGVPMVAITLIHRDGYFFQRIDESGWQHEDPVRWEPSERLTLLPNRAIVQIEGRDVHIRAWRHEVHGIHGHVVPVLMLDTDLEQNDPEDRDITQRLYEPDPRRRLRQEAILGIGGTRLLRALGHGDLRRFHMNEGHAALLTLELLREEVALSQRSPDDPDVEERVRKLCVFTTHTPVAAGHDRFPLDLVDRTLDATTLGLWRHREGESRFAAHGQLNMTDLGFTYSHFINGVASRHGEVARTLYPSVPVVSITNGVHARTWTSPSFRELFDRHLPSWRQDSSSLRQALGIPLAEIRATHQESKARLVRTVNSRTNAGLDESVFTIGFARRATAYKRAELILRDRERLRRIAREVGRIQIVFAGKSHPADHGGKEMIQRIAQACQELRPEIRAVYLPNYDMALAQTLIPGVDLWLNTPQPPLEASGTSGMKAAMNGVPSLSTLDGWWIEGVVEGVTGWSIGHDTWTPDSTVDPMGGSIGQSDDADAASLYDKLEHEILPMWYRRPDEYAAVMRAAIALNGSYFNTQRMMRDYVVRAYAF